ncbi:MAG: GNAT family N-acetyltransferase [candidate division Zixibacteria bacterium]|nr:GNAT family N-acetyltransferase [candidate division Zixibacteria bacterium]
MIKSEKMILRSATINDMPHIVRMIGEFDLDYEQLSPEQFLVIEEEGQVVAFGRLKPYPDAVELGSVGVRPDRRELGYGKKMVEALIKKAPGEIWITTNLRDYFRQFGFAESERMPASIKDKLENFCHFTPRPGIAAMVLRKTAGPSDGKK